MAKHKHTHTKKRTLYTPHPAGHEPKKGLTRALDSRSIVRLPSNLWTAFCVRRAHRVRRLQRNASCAHGRTPRTRIFVSGRTALSYSPRGSVRFGFRFYMMCVPKLCASIPK